LAKARVDGFFRSASENFRALFWTIAALTAGGPDLMAQLERAPDGLSMSEASKRMMVTNGNVTHVVEKLMATGDVLRETASHDRRVQVVRLSTQGRSEFRRMAKAHADWLAEFFAGLEPAEEAALMALLGKAKSSVRSAIDTENGPKEQA
jgi:DNA-binding MarR family transcriptional regulator